MPFTKYSDEVIARFEERVEKKGDDECWIWNGYKQKSGHGGITHNNKMIGAHRMSLELHLQREITAGLLVCHQPLICHNPSCVNPRHLREDTHSNNALDRHIDGTMAQAKLTEEQVLEIRASDKMQKDLSVEYGISDGMISRIISGKRWAHILPTK
jgi:hypothetical protein